MAHVVNLLVFLSESHSAAEGHGGANPYLIGAVTLAILLAALMVVVAIGGGRDHS